MSGASVQVKILKTMIENQQQTELKRSQKMRLRVGQQIEKPTPKPWEDKKDHEATFRKYISIGEDGEEHCDVIDKRYGN